MTSLLFKIILVVVVGKFKWCPTFAISNEETSFAYMFVRVLQNPGDPVAGSKHTRL